jgi:transposase
MAQNFLGCDREQSFLMPPSLDEWLPEDHFARFVIAMVGEMDLAAFYSDYRVDGHGRPAHDPAMMVALLAYAYSRGQRSSRVIERECIEDIAFRVIAANRQPDHCTIARFRQRHETALAGLFGEVLALCAKAGLTGVKVLAVDGTKVHANASERATRDYEQLAREILEEAAEIDAAEDEQFGDRRGDELPAELSSRQGRQKWLAEAKRQLDAQREREARPIPALRPARVKEAKRRLEEELWTEQRANDAYEAYRARGVMKNGREVRIAAQALPAARAADRQDQRHRPRLAQSQDAARLPAGLQRPSGLQRTADRGRPAPISTAPAATRATSARTSHPTPPGHAVKTPAPIRNSLHAQRHCRTSSDAVVPSGVGGARDPVSR